MSLKKETPSTLYLSAGTLEKNRPAHRVAAMVLARIA